MHRSLLRADARVGKDAALEVSRFQVHRLGAVEPVHAALLKAERATPQHTLEQLTELVPAKKGALQPRTGRRFKEAKPMLTRVTGAQAAAVLASLGPYRQMLEPQRQHLLSFYRPVDVAFKVVGTGRWVCATTASTSRAMVPAIRCFCRSKKRWPRRTQRICLMRIRRTTTGSARRRDRSRCRCSRTRSWAGRTLADGNTWCDS